jgi:hypothetical protein
MAAKEMLRSVLCRNLNIGIDPADANYGRDPTSGIEGLPTEFFSFVKHGLVDPQKVVEGGPFGIGNRFNGQIFRLEGLLSAPPDIGEKRLAISEE